MIDLRERTVEHREIALKVLFAKGFQECIQQLAELCFYALEWWSQEFLGNLR